MATGVSGPGAEAPPGATLRSNNSHASRIDPQARKLQQTPTVLASIILLGCLVAGIAAAVILFVLIGPVPTNRKVTMVSRIQPPLPTAAGPVAMPGMNVFNPAHATFTPPHATPVTQPFVTQPAFAQGSAPHVAPQFGSAPVTVPQAAIAAGTPAPDDEHTAVRARPKKALAPIAPQHLRRPRTAPHPLPRTRSARGTEPRPKQFEAEHTAQDVPMFDADDLTFIEDGQ